MLNISGIRLDPTEAKDLLNYHNLSPRPRCRCRGGCYFNRGWRWSDSSSEGTSPLDTVNIKSLFSEATGLNSDSAQLEMKDSLSVSNQAHEHQQTTTAGSATTARSTSPLHREFRERSNSQGQKAVALPQHDYPMFSEYDNSVECVHGINICDNVYQDICHDEYVSECEDMFVDSYDSFQNSSNYTNADEV